jgi:hypothetical protein
VAGRIHRLGLGDHDLRRFDDGRDGVAFLQRHFLRAALRDDGFDDATGNADGDVGKDNSNQNGETGIPPYSGAAPSCPSGNATVTT